MSRDDPKFIYTIHGEKDVSWFSMKRSVHTAEDIKAAKERASSATFGWTETFEEADELVRTNSCDIHETCFAYMVIEKYPEGIYLPPVEEHWYRWISTGLGHDQGYYEPCEKPAGLENVISFGIS